MWSSRILRDLNAAIQVCCHVHGVFPYCYVEYTGNLVPDEGGVPLSNARSDFDRVDAYIQKLKTSIDLYMAISHRKNANGSKNNAYVARITLCKGVPIYGFHIGWRFYLKIYMLNPIYIPRLSELLRNGSIMGRCVQPYEVHIPYLLQFMADYGLYGCGWVECRTVTFRAPVPKIDGLDTNQIWNDSTIAQHLITSSQDKPRLSYCAIEIDLQSHHILNRQTITPRLLHYDFIERNRQPPTNEKLVHSMAELWQEEERRHLQRGNEIRPPPSMYSSASQHDEENRGNGPWIHEAEMRAKLEELIQAERAKSDDPTLSFETFVRPARLQAFVQTALESVTDMFPPEAPSSSQKRENYVGVNTSSAQPNEISGDIPYLQVQEKHILSMLDEIECNADGSWNMKEEDYTSPESTDLASNIDFDGDLLGRAQVESTEKSIVHNEMLWQQQTHLYDDDSVTVKFADEIDVDFDFTPVTSKALHPEITNVMSDSLALANKNHRGTAMKPDEELEKMRSGLPSLRQEKGKRPSDPSLSSDHKRVRITDVKESARTFSVGLQSLPDTIKPRLSNKSLRRGSVPASRSLSSGRIIDVPSESNTVELTLPGSTSERSAQRHNDRIGELQHPIPQQRSSEHLRLAYTIIYPPFKVWIWNRRSPSSSRILSSLTTLGIPRMISRFAYYSKDEDVPILAREYGGKEFKLVSTSLPYLQHFSSMTNFRMSMFQNTITTVSETAAITRVWQIEQRPPIIIKAMTGHITEGATSNPGFASCTPDFFFPNMLIPGTQFVHPHRLSQVS